MSRPARKSRWILGVLLVGISTLGCAELDGRGANRKGNRQYREGKFADAAASYETALKTVKDDKIEYNIGLAYSKVFRAGAEDLILLAEKSESVCTLIPGTEVTSRTVCLKNDPDEEDRSYVKCTTDPKDGTCGTSGTCKKIDLCAIKNEKLVDLSAGHLTVWIEKQPPDEELKAKSAEISKDVEKVEKEIQEAEADIEKVTDATTGAVKDVQHEEEGHEVSSAVAGCGRMVDDEWCTSRASSQITWSCHNVTPSRTAAPPCSARRGSAQPRAP